MSKQTITPDYQELHERLLRLATITVNEPTDKNIRDLRVEVNSQISIAMSRGLTK